MVAEIEYGTAPESFRQFHADRPAYVVDEAEVAARLTVNHLRSIELCRKVRSIHPGALRVQLVDAHHATVASLSKATCRQHILSLDADGLPTHCALCPGYDSTRHCSHIGAYLLYFLRQLRVAKKVLRKALAKDVQEAADNGHRPIPTSGLFTTVHLGDRHGTVSHPRHPVAPQDIPEIESVAHRGQLFREEGSR